MNKKADFYQKGIDYLEQNEKEPLDSIRLPKYAREVVDIPARILNHWDKMDLMINKNPNGAKYSFSLVEAFWLKLIQKLRIYNLPLPLIKQLKLELCAVRNADDFQAIDKLDADILTSLDKSLTKSEIEKVLQSSEFRDMFNKVRPNLLESILLDMIIARFDIRLLFNENGEVFLFNDERPYSDEVDKQKLNVFLVKSYLNVSLFDIIKDLIKFLGEDECSKSPNILSKEEATVLKHLREGDVSKIEITFNDKTKKPETIKVTKKSSVSNFSRIQDLILRNGYQDITIKTQNGKVAHCESTTKHKLDTE
jgi:hypothetical protein